MGEDTRARSRRQVGSEHRAPKRRQQPAAAQSAEVLVANKCCSTSSDCGSFGSCSGGRCSKSPD